MAGSPVEPSGGLLEKMEASLYDQRTASTAAQQISKCNVLLNYLCATNSLFCSIGTPGNDPEGSSGAMVSTAARPRKDDHADETASMSSSSTSSSPTSSDDEAEEEAEGADYDVYEESTGRRGPATEVRQHTPQPPATAPAQPPVNSPAQATQQTQPDPALLTAAELHALPQNTTIKCLKASAMQVRVR